jgi:hypothetical protein
MNALDNNIICNYCNKNNANYIIICLKYNHYKFKHIFLIDNKEVEGIYGCIKCAKMWNLLNVFHHYDNICIPLSSLE